MNMEKELNKLRNKLRIYWNRITDNRKLNRAYNSSLFVPAILGIIMVALTGIVFYSGSSFRMNNLKEKADNNFLMAKYEEAIKDYNKMFQSRRDPLIAAKIADIYSIMGESDKSKEYIEKAKSMKNPSSEALNYIIFDELVNGDYNEAVKDGEAALNKYNEDKQLIKTMYAVYLAKGDSKAQTILNTFEADSKTAYDIAEYARMLMISGKLDQGLKQLRRAFEIDKDEYKIYDVLSQSSVYNKDELLEAVSKLSKDNESDPAYKMWMAKIYSLDKATATDSKKILDTLDIDSLGKYEINLILAVVYQNTNEQEKADEIIAKMIQENQGDYRILHTAGWYYLNKKDYDKALDYCRKSKEVNKDYTDNYGFLMPEILKARGQYYLSEPYFRIALQKEPYNYNIMINTANYYMGLDNKDKALNYFKLAEIVKPQDAELKYNMAVIYLTMKKDAEGIELLKSCIKIADSNPKYHRTLGTVYFLSGNKADALKEIRYAYNADENDILTLNNAGCYYVTEEYDVERGLFNLTKAVQGIDKNTDAYTKETINSNYKKVKQLSDDLKKSKINDKLKLPELVLFY